MVKLNGFTVLILIAISSLITYLVTSSSSETEMTTAVIESQVISDSNKEVVLTNNKDIHQSTIPDKQLVSSEPEANMVSEDTGLKTNLADRHFSSSVSVTNLFMTDNGQIKNQSISSVITTPAFQDFLNNLRVAEETDNSIEREVKLLEMLNQIRTNDVYAEDFACRGKVCAMSFHHEANSDFDLDKLRTFDENYLFKNTSKDESGSTMTRVLFIQTDNSSQLVLTNG
ncbi:hypothetical protein [Pseudoalteromonas gelatinilytica]|uniref:Uncharacterized protein n=1 Tax=Pseudoalteromonas gelatinilytica TaxID=1703256 RepID=A0A3A3EIS2_9GAMM|nr:hypothetical protein [Pseudoalteromonas profundi]RJF35381.1 hypothetical protein D4741_10395 [Pseudoalteromonas profundi]